MANILSPLLTGVEAALLSTSVIDIVAVLDQTTLTQVFQFARPLKATVNPTSKLLVHPGENGIVIADHAIFNPTEIMLPVIISAQNYTQTFNQIKTLYKNKTKLIVQTRLDVIQNMVIGDMPRDESADMYDAVAIGLKFVEVLFFPNPSTFSPTDPVNQSTVNSGQQQPALSNLSFTPGPHASNDFIGFQA